MQPLEMQGNVNPRKGSMISGLETESSEAALSLPDEFTQHSILAYHFELALFTKAFDLNPLLEESVISYFEIKALISSNLEDTCRKLLIHVGTKLIL